MSIDLIKENGFILKKVRTRQYPADTMTNTDYADDLALLTNTVAKAECFLHTLEQAVGGIGLYMNANKPEFMRFKQKEAISTLSVKPLKLVDHFAYISSNISSTESDVNICLLKV